MKITTRAVCGNEVDEAFLADRSPGTVLRLPDFDACSPAFDRLLEVSKTGRGCWFNPWMEFSAEELAQSRFLQLECRGKVIRSEGLTGFTLRPVFDSKTKAVTTLSFSSTAITSCRVR